MFHIVSVNHQAVRASSHTWLLIEFYLRYELAIERSLASCVNVRRFCMNMNMKSASWQTCLTGSIARLKKKINVLGAPAHHLHAPDITCLTDFY